MKKGDKIIYVGNSSVFYEKYKKYEIISIETLYFKDSVNYGTYIFFVNDLKNSDWLNITKLLENGFLTLKVFRKNKLNKLNEKC